MAQHLVTGGAGFIGSHIASALLDRGHRVRVYDNLSTGRSENLEAIGAQEGFEFVEADLTDRDALEKAIQGVEVVYHQAALPSVPRSLEAPLDTHHACVTGTLNLLDVSRLNGVRRVVYAASSSAYGDQPFMSKRESDSPSPLSPYAAAKLAGEYYCRAFAHSFDLETVAIRYFNVFGPRQDPGSAYSAVIPRFVTAMLSGERPRVFGDGTQSRDFTYIENVVEANLAAADAPDASGRVINVACGQQATLLQLVDRINGILRTEIKPDFGPPRASDPRESLADITLAREVLGYEVKVDFDEGLRRSISYYKSLAASPAHAA